MKRFGILLLALMMMTACFAASAEGLEDLSIAQDSAVQVDLDGDGEDETLAWSVVEEDFFEKALVEVTDASGDAVSWKSDMLYRVSVYICDLDRDGVREIFVTGDMSSGDYLTYCLNYRDGEIGQLTFADAAEGADTNDSHDCYYGLVEAIDCDRVTLGGPQDVVGTYTGSRTLALSDGALAYADDGLWHFDRDLDDEDAWENFGALTLTDTLDVTFNDGSQGTLSAGEKMMITASDKATVAYFQTQDGRKGSFNIEPNEEVGWGMLVNGIDENELFEFVPYAG